MIVKDSVFIFGSVFIYGFCKTLGFFTDCRGEKSWKNAEFSFLLHRLCATVACLLSFLGVYLVTAELPDPVTSLS